MIPFTVCYFTAAEHGVTRLMSLDIALTQEITDSARFEPEIRQSSDKLLKLS